MVSLPIRPPLSQPSLSRSVFSQNSKLPRTQIPWLSIHSGKQLRVSTHDASVSPSTDDDASSEQKQPTIELQFLGPKKGEDGSYPVENVSTMSGEKVLRNLMLENKIDIYAAYGKVMNCGGGGSCGTCIVEIIDGNDLLSERTGAELRYLKKKPESWRLACQIVVGDKVNSGKVLVQCQPQWKK